MLLALVGALAIVSATSCERDPTSTEREAANPPATRPAVEPEEDGTEPEHEASGEPAPTRAEDRHDHGESLDERLGVRWASAPEPLPECPVGARQRRRDIDEDVFDIECIDHEDRRHGPWSRWVGDGAQPVETARFVHGEPTGAWKIWDPQRHHLVGLETFDNGVLDGPAAEWTAEGRLVAIGAYLGGQRHGRWIQRVQQLDGTRRLRATCYSHGRVLWREQMPPPSEGSDAEPERAPSPAEAPSLYARDCDVEREDGLDVQRASDAPSALPDTPWRVGTRWVYRVTRDPRPGTTDEAATLDYLLERRIARVEPADDDTGRVVTLEERGGPNESPLRTVQYRVSETCIVPLEVPGSQKATACVHGAIGEREGAPELSEDERAARAPRMVPFADGVLEVWPMATDPSDRRLWLAPSVGPWRIEGPDRRDRTVRYELVGYELPEAPDDGAKRAAGRSEFEPVSCDWDHSKPVDATPTQLALPLSGAFGFVRLAVAFDGEKTVLRLERDAQDDTPFSESWPLALEAVKTWKAADAHAEYVLLHLSDEARERLVIYRLHADEAPPRAGTLDFERREEGNYAALLTSRDDTCLIQMRWRHDDVSRVRNINLTPTGLALGSGSL